MFISKDTDTYCINKSDIQACMDLISVLNTLGISKSDVDSFWRSQMQKLVDSIAVS
jgi:hypothetical protein